MLLSTRGWRISTTSKFLGKRIREKRQPQNDSTYLKWITPCKTNDAASLYTLDGGSDHQAGGIHPRHEWLAQLARPYPNKNKKSEKLTLFQVVQGSAVSEFDQVVCSEFWPARCLFTDLFAKINTDRHNAGPSWIWIINLFPWLIYLTDIL